MSRLPQGSPIQTELCQGTVVRIVAGDNEIFRQNQMDIAARNKKDNKFSLIMASSSLAAVLFGIFKARKANKFIKNPSKEKY